MCGRIRKNSCSHVGMRHGVGHGMGSEAAFHITLGVAAAGSKERQCQIRGVTPAYLHQLCCLPYLPLHLLPAMHHEQLPGVCSR
jgi:hypothetical protein